MGCFGGAERKKKEARRLLFVYLPLMHGRGEENLSLVVRWGAYLPQFLQSEAPRLTAEGFLVDLEPLQFLQFDCFIALPPTTYGVRERRALFAGKELPTRHTSLACAHNRDMEKKNTVNPTDEMIQGNKEEADSMLRLWGKKKRARIQRKPLRKK